MRAVAVTAALLSLAAACGLDDTEIIIGANPSEGDASPDATTVDASHDATNDGTVSDATLSDTGADTGADTGTDASDSGASDSGATDAESDAADASDAEVDAGFDAGVDAGPCPTLTICDGNPSACNGSQVCVPDVPAGWTLLGYDDSAHVSGALCGSSYAATSTNELQDGGASANCECDCDAGATPSCATTQITLTTGTACDQTPTTTTAPLGCNPLASPFAVQDSMIEATLQADPTTCTPNLITTNGSWSEGSSRECDFSGGAGSLCAAHSTCVDVSGSTHTACVKQAYAGDVPPSCATSCPSSYNTSCWAIAASITDNRMCNGCACGWSDPGCTAATLTDYDTADCMSGSEGVTTGACSTVSTVTSVAAIGIAGTDSSPTCGITTGASASGGVTLGTEELVCCSN
ncbi:MAG: hypothetical protein ACRELY_00240 [Polyangiaceae bacterium]